MSDSSERIRKEMVNVLFETIDKTDNPQAPELKQFIQESSFANVKQMYYENQQAKGEYKMFFKSKLKEYGVSSPDHLSDDMKKKFFDEVDAAWDARHERD
jgi:hypothetical protein